MTFADFFESGRKFLSNLKPCKLFQKQDESSTGELNHDHPEVSAATAQASSSQENSPFGGNTSEAIKGQTSADIWWECPCLEHIMKSPCSAEFKEAFSCYVDSREEPKGMDCIKSFQKLHECLTKHPEIFDDLDDEDLKESVTSSNSSTPQNH
eukprot:GCRY01001416.1.p1 GENE.GCRY01001416.1~~GCRY01001416.1.p1  ORF type:complete len:153 (-),score=20.22 GCRY01001416.1:199-657(-)